MPSQLAVADLNGDGIPDLALGNMSIESVNAGSGPFVAVLLGNGDGTFQAPVHYATGVRIASIAAGNVTSDKIPDLIVMHVAGDTTLL